MPKLPPQGPGQKNHVMSGFAPCSKGSGAWINQRSSPEVDNVKRVIKINSDISNIFQGIEDMQNEILALKERLNVLENK